MTSDTVSRPNKEMKEAMLNLDLSDEETPVKSITILFILY